MSTSDNIVNYHIDKNVIWVFVITFLITASVFAYRYTNYIPCEIVRFKIVDTENLRAGETIEFKDNTKGAIKREWDFGDNTEIIEDNTPIHTYKNPGQYTVRLMVNGNCEGTKLVTIKEPIIVTQPGALYVDFDIPRSIRVGEKLIAIDKTSGSNTWEWMFGEEKGVNSTSKNGEYTYNTTGEKRIILIVNGDVEHGRSKKITVLEKERIPSLPPTIGKPPKKGKGGGAGTIGIIPGFENDTIPEITAPPVVSPALIAPPISESEFVTKLMLLSQKKMSADDFKIYFCNKLDTKITVNTKGTTFKNFCNEIYGKKIIIKNRKKKKLVIKKDENNCITSITVYYSKTSLL